MLARATCLGALLIGCNFTHGTVVETATRDGAIDDVDAPAADARIDAPPGSVCFGAGLVVECYPPDMVPTGPYAPVGLVDTSSPVTCTRVIEQVGGPDLCLRAAGTITIGDYVRFKGPRPIVLLATTSIEITATGVLDVSSFRIDVGAGGNTGACGSAGPGTSDTRSSANAGAGGGGGGGFGTPGGDGGTSDAAGGSGGGTTALAQIRGGCRGARGGNSKDGIGGNGGNGGGAAYLIAGTSIAVAGGIEANGSGGGGGPNKAGGGGGGSGGLIAFDAPSVTISGTVFANGGGGGEGGGGGHSGENGHDPIAYDQRAAGGGQLSSGGDGGGGSVFANTGVTGGTANNGGGGGGGGAGRIKVYQSDVPSGKISPPAN